MVFEHIEKLKREYTDKFVIVDETRPELRRFGGMTGTVRTVNMSGRALVEFDAYANIGWYDIDVDFLKVIDAPLPKPEAKKAEAKASPKEKAAPAAKKAAPAAKPASGAGMSVADMLAAARGDKSGGAAAPATKPSSAAEIMAAARSEKAGGAAPAKVDPKSMSVADMLAAARGEKSGGAPAAKAAAPAASAPAAAPKKDPKSMSVAEMLAAARGEKGGGDTTAAATSTSADPKAGVRDMLEAARKPKPGAAPSEEPVAEEASAPQPASSGSGGRRNDITSVAEQLAYCRKIDAS